MPGELLSKLSPRLRRAGLVLLTAAVVTGTGAFVAAKTGLATAQQTGGFLALCFVLLLAGLLLFAVSWLGRSGR